MKKILLSIALFATMTYADDIMKIDTNVVCNAKKNGAEKVLALAEKYNPIAVKKGLEFKRLGVKNSAAIKAIKAAIKAKKKEVVVEVKKKGKVKKQKFALDYAATRACKFAIVALQYDKEAETTYRAAIPGDGFKY